MILLKTKRTILYIAILSLLFQTFSITYPVVARNGFFFGPSFDNFIVAPAYGYDGSLTSLSPNISVHITDSSDITTCQYRWKTTKTDDASEEPYISNWQTGTLTADADGFTCTSPTISDIHAGSHYFSGEISATDSSDLTISTSMSKPRLMLESNLVLDATISGPVSTDKQSIPTISGTVNDPNATITVHICSNDDCNTEYSVFDASNYGDTWDAQMTESDAESIPDGIYSIVIIVDSTDANYSPNEIAKYSTYTVDSTPPIIQSHDDISITIPESKSSTKVVYITPNTVDNMDNDSPAICSPQSNTIFPIGSTTITCTKTDTFGNEAIPTTFNVIISHNPRITSMSIAGQNGVITGSDINFNLAGVTQDELDSGGKITINKDSDLQINAPSGSISLSHGVNLRSLLDVFGYPQPITRQDLIDLAATNNGIITLDGNLIDSNNNSVYVKFNISMIDIEAPKIQLNGDSNISIEYGGKYTEPGATWTDNIDKPGGDVTDIFGFIDTSKVGTYIITYSKIDEANNKATAIRTVTINPEPVIAVTPAIDKTPPSISTTISDVFFNTPETNNPTLPATPEVLGTQTTNNQTDDKKSIDNPTPTLAPEPKTNPLDFTFLGIRSWIWLLIIAIGDFLYTISSSRRK